MSGTIFHPFVLDNAAGQETVVGIGSDSVKYGVGISSDTHVTGIQTVTGFLHAGGGIKDTSGDIGSSGKVLSSTGSGLQWIDPSEGSTANAVNVGTNLNSTNADQFVAFMGASSGNNPVRVDGNLKYNPSTNILTAPSFSGNLTGTIQTAAQTNITSVGTLTGLTVNGNITQSGTSNYIRINGGLQDKDGQDGDSGQVLSSTGTQVNWINVGDISAGSASQVAVSDESGDQTCFPLFVTSATGNQAPKSGSNLTFNSSTGQLNATKFVGDGSGLTNISTLNQSTTGNAATATALQNARTIGGVSFDGTANINLPGVNAAGNQNTSGNAATATKLATARNIAGTSFDGTASINISYNNLTNKPTIPTNNNQLTNGAGYVTLAGAVPSGVIVLWSGAANAIPTGWVLCNGSNSTPDLRDRFVIGAGNSYNVNDTGGESTKLLGTANLPSHTHTSGSLSATGGNHVHQYIDQYVVINNGYRPWPASNNDCAQRNIDTSGSGSHSHTVSGNTGDQGGTMGQSFSILPPYYALCYIMKT